MAMVMAACGMRSDRVSFRLQRRGPAGISNRIAGGEKHPPNLMRVMPPKGSVRESHGSLRTMIKEHSYGGESEISRGNGAG